MLLLKNDKLGNKDQALWESVLTLMMEYKFKEK